MHVQIPDLSLQWLDNLFDFIVGISKQKIEMKTSNRYWCRRPKAKDLLGYGDTTLSWEPLPMSPEEGAALSWAVSELARAQQARALTIRYMKNAAGH